MAKNSQPRSVGTLCRLGESGYFIGRREIRMKIFHIDAFTDGPFTGNPAAVCVLDREVSEVWLQQVAAEMNLSETAFVRQRGEAWDLRWFTPAVEVDLCGHATLAASHALWLEGVRETTLRYDTRSGRLTARRDGDWILLDFPATPAEAQTAPPELLEALGVARPLFAGRSKFDWLFEIESEQTLRELQPDFAKLGRVTSRGVIVTSRSASSDYDFASRFFAPAVGIDEDPATGSAHCCLGPYWQARSGKSDLLARQLSQRGAVLQVRVRRERVELGGRAIAVLQGELLV